MSTTDQASKANDFRALHRRAQLLQLINVWDVASAHAVAGRPDTHAIATASASIAAAHGYEDGENIPLDLHLAAIERICAAVPLPVTADLERGYGDAFATVTAAIGVGAVGVNLEDDLGPAPEFAAAVAEAVRAGARTGIPLVVNARTDIYLSASTVDPTSRCDEAIARGLAYLGAGADCVFVPGLVDQREIARVTAAFGPQRLSLLAQPGIPRSSILEALGVARVSHGPAPLRVAMATLAGWDTDP